MAFTPAGVIPATLLAFHEDFSIDEAGTRQHLRDVAATDGISAITVNGHASEVHACTEAEQQRVLALTLDEVGDRLPVVSGVWADGSANAARIARMAAAEGASALLIFPSQVFAMGGQLRPEMVLAHFSEIAAATDLPLIVFAYPERSTVSYPLETLVRLAEAIPSVRAIKDWCNDPALHERHVRTLQSLTRPVNVLSTHSAWLMASLALGCNGLLSGSGSVIPDLQVALWRAVQAGDLPAARAVHERIYPLAEAFYAAPALDMHNRMKECLVMLGRMQRAVVRPPLAKITDAERARLHAAVGQAGLATTRLDRAA
ncbi:MAG: dihydrodipicolinate synthase family protein [Rhodospirillales bacterium]|jgi:4-hydroxy-tetrahydrodipicolinate synthase|nr:dihydrodipicolinate synthase family protein [Rhodospirillales bacterium]